MCGCIGFKLNQVPLSELEHYQRKIGRFFDEYSKIIRRVRRAYHGDESPSQ